VNRTRAQRRYRRKGYTWEIAPLRNPSPSTPKLVVIHKPGQWGWRSYRPYLLDFMGEVIRPVAKHYIHNGGKP
jgi:hypothetical protein